MLSDIISTSLRLYVSMDGRMEGWMYPSCTFTHFVMHVFIVCARRACIHMFTFTFMYADIYMNHRCTCLICIHYKWPFSMSLFVCLPGRVPPISSPSAAEHPRSSTLLCRVRTFTWVMLRNGATWASKRSLSLCAQKMHQKAHHDSRSYSV